ncbi:hypothetical protein HRED_06867 [Candidatus Haloredivivus sp. G17]|nr:hypothetical protein HRED_06867 [Candidatus Haloredivivus sp. G17]
MNDSPDAKDDTRILKIIIDAAEAATRPPSGINIIPIRDASDSLLNSSDEI